MSKDNTKRKTKVHTSIMGARTAITSVMGAKRGAARGTVLPTHTTPSPTLADLGEMHRRLLADLGADDDEA